MPVGEIERDLPGVIVFPPLIPLGMLICSAAFGFLLPLHWLDRIAFPVRLVLGAVLAGVGGAIAVAAQRRMKVQGTNVSPRQPTRLLVTEGIFARTRNPIYLGGLLIFTAAILWFHLDWGILFLVPGTLLLHYGVILREERYLNRKFGDAYRAYADRVPRYWKIFLSG
jgi:protein-S-isoprenylcysteine O-methyltransferase Ste14